MNGFILENFKYSVNPPSILIAWIPILSKNMQARLEVTPVLQNTYNFFDYKYFP